MSGLDTTRRSLLRLGTGALAYGAGAAAVAGGFALASEAKSAPARGGVNPRLLRTMALFERVETEGKRFFEEVETPARLACQAAIDAYEGDAPPPHEESKTAFINWEGQVTRLCTRTNCAATSRRVVSDPTWADMGDEPWREAHREIALAHDRRDALLAAQAKEKDAFAKDVRLRLRIPEIHDRSNNITTRASNLWHAALDLPATSLADVIAKLDFIDRWTGEDEDRTDMLAAIVSDVRHLAKEPEARA